jgi:hypothetical protein
LAWGKANAKEFGVVKHESLKIPKIFHAHLLRSPSSATFSAKPTRVAPHRIWAVALREADPTDSFRQAGEAGVANRPIAPAGDANGLVYQYPNYSTAGSGFVDLVMGGRPVL